MHDTIFIALRESHERQRSLMRRLLRTRPGPDRAALFTALRIELAAHEAAEERHLYVDMLMDDRGLEPSRDALADHHKMDKIVESLRKLGPARAGWINMLHKLSRELHEHLHEEETIFFQMAGKIIGTARKRLLARRYRSGHRAMVRKLESGKG